MNENITAVRFGGDMPLSERSAIMKRVFAHLYASGGVTYSQFLFPYADSLLLSDMSADCFFGSCALLWQITPERLMQSIEAMCDDISAISPQITEIELTAASVSDFLDDTYNSGEGSICVGNFSALLSGNIRPWTIREHSRGLCSFAEHIDRMKGCAVVGFCGGRLVISTEEDPDEEKLAALYSSKTGGIAEFIK